MTTLEFINDMLKALSPSANRLREIPHAPPVPPCTNRICHDATVRGRHHLCTFQRRHVILFAMSKGKAANQKKSEVLQGTLDLMVLKTLQALGPLHGFGIARRLEQLSEEVL